MCSAERARQLAWLLFACAALTGRREQPCRFRRPTPPDQGGDARLFYSSSRLASMAHCFSYPTGLTRNSIRGIMELYGYYNF